MIIRKYFLNQFQAIILAFSGLLLVPGCNGRNGTSTFKGDGPPPPGMVSQTEKSTDSKVPEHWEIVTQYETENPTNRSDIFDLNGGQQRIYCKSLTLDGKVQLYVLKPGSSPALAATPPEINLLPNQGTITQVLNLKKGRYAIFSKDGHGRYEVLLEEYR